MLTKRIIPCMDIQNGGIVKGINFLNMHKVGEPIEQSHHYAEQGADELVYLDITATEEKRKVFLSLVREIAKAINIPFTVGGGISGIEDVSALLDAGADKISVNSAAVKKPELITELAKRFGSQCIVIAMDTKQEQDDWYVYVNGGKTRMSIKTKDWAKQAESLGAGEILLTSMNNDGTKKGFAIDIIKTISQSVSIPVIASGGAGSMEHFADVFTAGKADAALAASVFHYKEIEIPVLKQFLSTHNIPIRK